MDDVEKKRLKTKRLLRTSNDTYLIYVMKMGYTQVSDILKDLVYEELKAEKPNMAIKSMPYYIKKNLGHAIYNNTGESVTFYYWKSKTPGDPFMVVTYAFKKHQLILEVNSKNKFLEAVRKKEPIESLRYVLSKEEIKAP